MKILMLKKLKILTKKNKMKTTYKHPLSFSEWCKEFRVSSNYQKKMWFQRTPEETEKLITYFKNKHNEKQKTNVVRPTSS